MQDAGQKFVDLVQLVARLRAPDGCPWDRKQTPQSFKSYLIEEAHELIEAIDLNDPEEIREELGDLLFQLIFISRLYEEQDGHGIAEVIDAIAAKMVRRHPHVFGNAPADSEEELHRRWQDIKSQEKARKKPHRNHLAAVPRSLPALRRAQRVFERAAKSSASRLTLDDAMRTMDEESKRLREALKSEASQEAAAACGDLLSTLVRICGLANVGAEDALQATTDKVIRRYSEGSARDAGAVVQPGKKV